MIQNCRQFAQDGVGMVICNQLVDVLKFAVSIDSWLSHTWLKCYRYVGVNPNFCDIIRPDIPKKAL